MAFCGKCGSALAEGMNFCSRCGAPVRPEAAPGRAPAAAGGGMTPNVAAALSYVLGFITGIIFLVVEPYRGDRFVRFHAFQSIFFSVALTVFWIAWSNIVLLSFAGLALFGFLGLLSSLVSLAALLYWLFLMYKAYNYEQHMIPVLGELAAKQSG